MSYTSFNILFTRFLRVFVLRAIVSSTSFTYYFFLFATVRRGPLRVRALFLEF